MKDFARFDALAFSQRGDAEEAMIRIQRIQVCQVYGYLCEHIGDLTHRMSARAETGKGQYHTVLEKTAKTLRILENPADISDILGDQAKRNFDFYHREGQHYLTDKTVRERWKSPATAMLELRKLGELYAIEHEKLPVFNTVQRIAQSAAVAIGHFRLAKCRDELKSLMAILKRGQKNWERVALEVDPEYVEAV